MLSQKCKEVKDFNEEASTPSSRLCHGLPEWKQTLRFLLQGEECSQEVTSPLIDESLVGRSVVFKLFDDGWVKGYINRIIRNDERRFTTQNVVIVLSKRRAEAITLTTTNYFGAARCHEFKSQHTSTSAGAWCLLVDKKEAALPPARQPSEALLSLPKGSINDGVTAKSFDASKESECFGKVQALQGASFSFHTSLLQHTWIRIV
jgi:hypothetical protein